MNNFIDKFNAVPLGQKVLVLVILMIALFVAFWMLLYTPMGDDIVKTENEIAELDQEKRRLDEIKRRRAEAIARKEDLTRQLLVAREKLPATAEIPSLLQRIHNQGKTAGLEINRFQRKNDVVRTDFVEIPVDMALAGSFDEVANFFYYIARMTRIVNMENIDMKRSGSGLTPGGDLTVTANAKTFRWAPTN
ncbi:MAG: type 4a pilus biogenesis protein PilO [Bradymonadaceae bacterium]